VVAELGQVWVEVVGVDGLQRLTDLLVEQGRRPWLSCW
jgi:hypothetical protein